MNHKRYIPILALVVIVILCVRHVNADFTFGEPTNLGPTVNSSAVDAIPSISADGLSLYFNSNRSGGYDGFDLWVTTRETISDPWDAPVNLGPTINSSYDDAAPSISADGLTLYFNSDRSGGYGGWDIWVTTRQNTEDEWGTPINPGSIVNSPYKDVAPSITADGLSLFFVSDRSGGSGNSDIWVTTRATISDDWGSPVNLSPTVNSSSFDATPSISADGLLLFFQSNRAGGYGGFDIYVSRRATENDPWGEPVNLGPTVNSSNFEGNPSISADGSSLYFFTKRSGGSGNGDLWEVPIIPIVDFNDDGIVDAADMCIIVDNWGTDESLCDIGPMPWGDGIVDVQDLIVLAEHLFEEIPPTEPVE
jgi:Tol biopolymer transport system component